ncbi:MAG: GHKL domain-containing protein [Bacteroidales bacterium]|nr:GHKL domain-containing protein [Bacteroidales bacterium]
MIWNKYSIKLFVFLVVLSLFGIAFIWSLNTSLLIVTKIVLALAFILIFVFLLKYLNKTNRDLINFLETIKHLDNVPASNSTDLSFNQLNITYNEITKQLKDAWVAKEYEQQYFQYTLENIGTGILSFDMEGNVELYNKAAKKILGINKLTKINELDQIGDDLQKLEIGQTKLIKLNTHIDQQVVLVKSTDIKIGKKELKLISLQDIKTQLEESELEAWQKLIRVLTHEIMNSVTPIKSLTYSMQKLLKSDENDPEKNQNILKGLAAIEKRSKGLLDFVESYKNLTQIPKLSYGRIEIKKLIENITGLLNENLNNEKIKIVVDVTPEDISVIADEKLITQVIINLIQNSIKAFHNQNEKIIQIKSEYSSLDKVIIQIIDNGEGIQPEIIDKIFVPFFSTRDEGSGIGLSFARQVMVLHNGRIDVMSVVREKTIFTLTL